MNRKTTRFGRWGVTIALAAITLTALPLIANEIVVKSDANNLGAAVASTGDSGLTTYNAAEMSALTFVSVNPSAEGTFTSLPAGAPTGTIVVNVPTSAGTGSENSGFIETTFTLPTDFSDIKLAGVGNVDDGGYVFLNGHLIGGELSEYGDIAFNTTDLSYFQSGVNTLVISDINYGGGPSGVAYYADVTYETSSVPEPSSLLFLGSGLAALLGMAKRKAGLKA